MTGLVSVHGGHSGEFCSHAEDELTPIVEEYARKGFQAVCLSEHMPPPDVRLFYPEERAAGMSAADARARFERYFQTARELQARFAGRMQIVVGFETEAWNGYLNCIEELVNAFNPDYMVGSIHHIDDLPYDVSAEEWRATCDALGGAERMYCRYFDIQLEMIERLKPPVVGHLDLVRKFDPDYPAHLALPEVRRRIERNLDLIADLGLCLDYNTAPLRRGQREAYPSMPLLELAIARDINILPGDDSHGVASVGAGVREALELLHAKGARSDWKAVKRMSRSR